MYSVIIRRRIIKCSTCRTMLMLFDGHRTNGVPLRTVIAQTGGAIMEQTFFKYKYLPFGD